MRLRIILIMCLAILGLSCSNTAPDYSKPDMVINADLPQGDATWESANQNSVWVFPSSIQIGAVGPEQVSQHYLSGIKIVYPIVIHASNETLQFHLSYQGVGYDKVSSTYSPSPAGAVGWVSFPEPDPVLQAYETREVPVEFFVPKNASAPPRWEFLVRVDWQQMEFFQQARAVLFQINMRVNET